MRSAVVRRSLGLPAIVAVLASPLQGQQAGRPDLSLDSLLKTRISTASKYDQVSTEAPSSVSIVTAEDIRNHGYRNLQEVLESVRGFYVSNDRNYPYLGARGFGRPSDYNNRVLVLVDDHALNELVWGGAPIGTDLPLNLAAVERVEVVQGPGSSLYGTSAMFAVINIVMKSGNALDGADVRAGVGSAGERMASMAAGRALGARGQISGSALVTRSAGFDQYYREYDDPATHDGIARNADWERAGGALGSLTWAALTAHAGFKSRDKGVPTGQYETIFGDTRTRTNDQLLWGDVGLSHAWSGSLSGSAKLYATHMKYWGVLPHLPTDPAYADLGVSTATGLENMLTWEPNSRDRLTMGTDVKRVSRASYAVRLEDGSSQSDDAPFTVLSAFAQNDLQLLSRTTLVAGLRVDRYSTAGSAVTPRLALLITPDAATTVKLLYGEAFRAPSPAEALLTSGGYVANPGLAPERVRTTEIDVQRRLSTPLLLGVSLYRYRISNLIDQVPVDPVLYSYANVSEAVARGAEAQLDFRPRGAFDVRATYAIQRTKDGDGVALTNSPERIGTLAISANAGVGLHGAVDLRHESGRLTSGGPATPAFTRVDANVGYELPRALGPAWVRPELSLRVTNVFDVAYSTPAGVGNRQSSIAADGRMLALRMDWHL